MFNHGCCIPHVDLLLLFVFVRFRIEQPVYINIIRDPINRFLSNYFFRRFGDWRGEQNHLIRTPGMKDDERYLVRLFSGIIIVCFIDICSILKYSVMCIAFH